MIAPCGWSASAISEPSGSSGEISPIVIARPNTSAVSDLASEKDSYCAFSFPGVSTSDATRQPCR